MTLKLFCDALKSAAHCEMKTNGNEAPPAGSFSSARAGAARATVDMATAAEARIARVRRTGISFMVAMCLRSGR